MNASLAKGAPHGFEVGYDPSPSTDDAGQRRTDTSEQGERVLFHILNGSATEIRSLALPGHSSP